MSPHNAQELETAPSPEEARLRAAYERRKLEIPKQWYSFFSPGNLLHIQERERRVLGLLTKHMQAPLEEMKILEVGCGTGFWLREFIKWGASPENLVGLDLLEDRIEECKRLCPSGVKVQCGNATNIDSPGENFDLVLQSTVFSLILDVGTRRRMANEMVRVLRREGIILWYDLFMNNPNNADVRAINRNDIRALFPTCKVTFSRITLAPPLARWLAPHARAICDVLTGLRFLDTHLIAVISKPKTNGN